MRYSRWPTRWAIRCTRCCRTRTSRSCTRDTRSSSPREALFLEYMLSRTSDQRERVVLLQHAIDGIVGTFYTQVMFADYERQAHRLVEDGKPVTADALSEIYF